YPTVNATIEEQSMTTSTDTVVFSCWPDERGLLYTVTRVEDGLVTITDASGRSRRINPAAIHPTATLPYGPPRSAGYTPEHPVTTPANGLATVRTINEEGQ
ncbi:hypothetical protein, partial [Streptomyces clavuligerus]|uniref:hypothetical protein n=2 Tax=Streptomyces clavuligerus TaxID=1901 RepID=UPI0018D1670F